jgi:hypothetical protein
MGLELSAGTRNKSLLLLFFRKEDSCFSCFVARPPRRVGAATGWGAVAFIIKP